MWSYDYQNLINFVFNKFAPLLKMNKLMQLDYRQVTFNVRCVSYWLDIKSLFKKISKKKKSTDIDWRVAALI